MGDRLPRDPLCGRRIRGPLVSQAYSNPARLKSSKGPWRFATPLGEALPAVLADQVTSYGNFYVAQCNVDADAQLIALAPDMLALLARIAETPCNHGPQEFCPREAAHALLGRLQS